MHVSQDSDVISPQAFDNGDATEIDLLHEIGSRIAAADPLQTVLTRVVEFVPDGFKRFRGRIFVVFAGIL